MPIRSFLRTKITGRRPHQSAEPASLRERFRPGQVLVHHGSTTPRLVLVDSVLTHIVEVTTADGISTVAPAEELVPCSLPEEVAALVATLLREHALALSDNTTMEQQMLSVRDWAIAKHREGYYCLQGLNDFLRSHDLLPYAPRYRARLIVDLDVASAADDSPLTDGMLASDVRPTVGPSMVIMDSTTTIASFTEIDDA